QHGAALHATQAGRVDQPLGLRHERDTDDDEIALREEFVEALERIRGIHLTGAGRSTGAGDDAGAERTAARRDLATHPAEAEDADGAAVQLVAQRSVHRPAVLPGPGAKTVLHRLPPVRPHQ